MHDHGHHPHPEPSPLDPSVNPSPTGRSPSDGQGAHDRHGGHSVAMFRDRFWIALVLTVPTVTWSAMIQHWFGYTAPSFVGAEWIPPLFGTAVYVYPKFDT